MSVRPTVISLFTGGGGMDLGFAAAGFSISLATDLDPFSCRTLQLNKGKKWYLKRISVLEVDICETPTKSLLQAADKRRDQIDLVIGGPPCQAFSVNGRRGGLEDPRSKLVWEYLRVIEEIRPTAFVFENVVGLRTIHDGMLYRDLIKALSLDGSYAISDHVYELAEFGIPQFRKRVFFIGHKNGIRIPPISPSHGETLFTRRPFVTVGTVLEGMPEPTTSIPNHQGRKHSQRIIDRYASLEYGERDSKTRINKLHPNRPSFTIVVGSDAGGGKGHVHPYTPREVTPRESARMQTFPDWWEFSGTGRNVIRQVGNAVPPLFAAQLADQIRQFVFGKKRSTSYDQFVERLDLQYLRSKNDR